MDIFLTTASQGVQLAAKSIHGVLWLQTHFEESNWEALLTSQVLISRNDAETLTQDAKEAGISICFIPSFLISGKSLKTN